ncbi:hypothetical protein AVEN_192716-1 [Araneus ventricosus]|uniref:Uncharacterized protein n=1 Tax=Araneus ventricosus TaxID=182803 RepID=A0A4Y2RNW1_ARAVE|nr:hypothetical protein AVEN_192716-1 [Araneus ventricosus]
MTRTTPGLAPFSKLPHHIRQQFKDGESSVESSFESGTLQPKAETLSRPSTVLKLIATSQPLVFPVWAYVTGMSPRLSSTIPPPPTDSPDWNSQGSVNKGLPFVFMQMGN